MAEFGGMAAPRDGLDTAHRALRDSPAPDPATRAEGIADYRPTKAQDLMREEMRGIDAVRRDVQTQIEQGQREPVKLGSVLDELFDKMTAQREAEQRYPQSEGLSKTKQQAFIAGAEWWASHGIPS